MTNEITTTQLYELLKKSQEEQTERVLENLKQVCSTKLEKTEIQCKKLEQKYLQIERKIRKNNVVIFGLPTVKENLVGKTLIELNRLLDLHLTEADINNCYVVGREQANQGIVLEFISYLKKQLLFNNINKIKDKKISITNDLCPEDQIYQRQLRKHLNVARQNKQQARIKGHLLEIEGTSYTLEQLEGKESEIEENDGEEEEGEYLEEGGYSKEAAKKTRNKKKNPIQTVRKNTRLDVLVAKKK